MLPFVESVETLLLSRVVETPSRNGDLIVGYNVETEAVDILVYKEWKKKD